VRPNRQPEHRAHIDQRRKELREELHRLISPGMRFVWEVGSGHGHYLTAYAAAHPGVHCIGIDIASDRVARANRKRDRGKLANLNFLLADAEDFLAVMPASAHFAAVFLLFPDPWPKRRHHKNRVMTVEFLSATAARAGQGTGLYFRTDHEPYFREGTAIVCGHPEWNESAPASWPFEQPTVFQNRAHRHFTLVAKRR
jgi:tRNA (guanine-N7-)-methyltransferase